MESGTLAPQLGASTMEVYKLASRRPAAMAAKAPRKIDRVIVIFLVYLDNALNNGDEHKKLGHCPKKMSKTEISLETKIVETALKMFNESGVEYVGMRELATKLDIRIGNLNYYFPTKDDLVNRISMELAEENSRTIIPMDQITMPLFFDMLLQVFRNHLKYRCMMLSFVHIVQRNPAISKRYSKTNSNRNATWFKNIQGLID